MKNIALTIACVLIVLFLVSNFRKKDNVSKNNIEVAISNLVELIFDEDVENIKDSIISWYNNPKLFFKNNPDIFEDYYLKEDEVLDDVDNSLIVLFYFMNKKNKGFALDWKQENEDTIYFINQMLEEKKIEHIEIVSDDSGINESEMSLLSSYFDYNDKAYLDTYEFILKCNQEINKVDISICELGRGNDEYEIFLVDNNKLNQIEMINQLLGFSIAPFK
ncbi:DUF6630 family protein [Oceanirhabdus sp. W0125-5]|uniref:DUF6630 family protein n=1 Tax=Oceanirhabdus sp. W0125-5 TaxID=2999116 RepID=UPI0022F31C1D|nr:hypothetical protein [Oceanirhabdus sp. W0125-5]WBW96741.1 hypothetical protein OW730_24075 [Oceanirhabdus sp. W0125-5]